MRVQWSMSKTTDQPIPSATERADALLTRWGQSLNPVRRPAPLAEEASRPTADAPRAAPDPRPVQRADSLLGRVGHRLSGRGLVEAAAYGYVAVAIRTGRAANAAQETWQKSVQAARKQQEQRTAQTGGARAARQVAADEKKGEQVLKQTEEDAKSDAEKGVDVAADAAA